MKTLLLVRDPPKLKSKPKIYDYVGFPVSKFEEAYYGGNLVEYFKFYKN